MQNKIKNAFSQIKAEEQLKEKTKQALYNKSANKKSGYSFTFKKFALAPIALAVTLALSYFLFSYNIQVSAISIDINPSIELGINQYSRIISTTAYNKDGEELLSSANVKNLTYEEGINKILECDKTQQYINDDNVVVITVDSENSSDEIIENIEENVTQDVDMYCSKSNHSVLEEAHSCGLSFGKYNAYLELKEYEPDITTDEISKMTMKEIKNKILNYKNENSDNNNNSSDGNCMQNGKTESTSCTQNSSHNCGEVQNNYSANKQDHSSQGKHYGKGNN